VPHRQIFPVIAESLPSIHAFCMAAAAPFNRDDLSCRKGDRQRTGTHCLPIHVDSASATVVSKHSSDAECASIRSSNGQGHIERMN
jgi:hypothetical protein